MTVPVLLIGAGILLTLLGLGGKIAGEKLHIDALERAPARVLGFVLGLVMLASGIRLFIFDRSTQAVSQNAQSTQILTPNTAVGAAMVGQTESVKPARYDFESGDAMGWRSQDFAGVAACTGVMATDSRSHSGRRALTMNLQLDGTEL